MESVYNLIPQEQRYESTTFKHTSKHATRVQKEVSDSKAEGKLYGPTKDIRPNPKTFMKKGHGDTIRSMAAKPYAPERKQQTILAPAVSKRMSKDHHDFVPRHNETAPLAPPSNKDFIVTNRKEMKQAPPAKFTAAYIDKPAGTGARFETENSGLVPKYTKKATYGKTPKYLTKRKDALATQPVTQRMEPQSHIRQISEDERMQILSGLRNNWEQIHREYQGLSMFTDTIPKKTKRNNMEAKLNQLEADIHRFERHGAIFVDTSA
jgi:hypothetical protein